MIIKKKISNWFTNHPNLWVNPLSINSIFRAITGPIRVLPDFIIIGAAKAGTTSLYDSLIKHPSIYPALWKEIYFFDRYYPRGISWYRANFASKIKKSFVIQVKRKSFLTGEATPTYIHHPLAAKRISEILPHIKLIVLLRNPIDRAYSHYQMEKQLGYEDLSFEKAIELENSRIEGEYEKMIQDSNYYSYKRQIFSYLTSGIYVEQLKTWMKYIPKNQFLIIKSEDFDNSQAKIFKEIENYLGIIHSPITLVKTNVGNYESMNLETRKKLIEFFEPHNQRLYSLLNRDFRWK
jgi:hypothetical protein